MKWKKWIILPWGALLLLTAASAAGLTAVFVRGWGEHPAAIAVYMLAFGTLTLDCIAAWRTVPGWYRRIRQAVYENPVGSRYMTDPVFKTQVSLWRSLAINLAYAAVNLLNMHWQRSAWFAILAFYYSILAVMRFLLVWYVRKNPIGESVVREWTRARGCAWILLTLNLVLSGAVLMILYQNRGFAYHGMLIYVMAAYTFYITVHAIVDMVRCRRSGSPVMAAAKAITLCAAMVSMLSLETAMLSQFGGEMTPESRWILIAATGGGVSVIVVALSVSLIVHAGRELRKKE